MRTLALATAVLALEAAPGRQAVPPDGSPRDYAARDALVTAHLHLVRHAAQRLKNRLSALASKEDLIGDGTLGLMAAAEAFDPSRGVTFRTYASWRIRGAMIDGIRRMDWGPRHGRATAERRGKHFPEMHALVTFRSRYNDEEGPYVGHIVEREETCRTLLAHLPDRARRIVELHYGRGLTLAAIARRMNLSRARVQQIHRAALERMRDGQE